MSTEIFAAIGWLAVPTAFLIGRWAGIRVAHKIEDEYVRQSTRQCVSCEEWIVRQHYPYCPGCGAGPQE